MKSHELFEQIMCGEIKDGTKIKVINELLGNCITTIEYNNGRLNWKSGEFDTSFLCNCDIDFEVENKEIEEIKITASIETKNNDLKLLENLIHICEDKINELARAVNKMNKESE